MTSSSDQNLPPPLSIAEVPLLSKEDWRLEVWGWAGSEIEGKQIGLTAAVAVCHFFLCRLVLTQRNRRMRTPMPRKSTFQLSGGGDGLIGLPGLGLGSKQKRLAENLLILCAEVPSEPTQSSYKIPVDTHSGARLPERVKLMIEEMKAKKQVYVKIYFLLAESLQNFRMCWSRYLVCLLSL